MIGETHIPRTLVHVVEGNFLEARGQTVAEADACMSCNVLCLGVSCGVQSISVWVRLTATRRLEAFGGVWRRFPDGSRRVYSTRTTRTTCSLK